MTQYTYKASVPGTILLVLILVTLLTTMIIHPSTASISTVHAVWLALATLALVVASCFVRTDTWMYGVLLAVFLFGTRGVFG